MMKKILLNNSGVSIVQGLMLLSLVAGMGLGVMNVNQAQRVQNKRLETSSDIHKAQRAIFQGLSGKDACTAAFAGISVTPGPAVPTNPATENLNELLNNRAPIAVDLRARSGAVMVQNTPRSGTEREITTSAKLVSITPLPREQISSSVLGSSLIRVEIYVIMEDNSSLLSLSSDTVNVATPGGPVQTIVRNGKRVRKKLPESLVVETDGAGVVTDCYSSYDAVLNAIDLACRSIGGVGANDDLTCILRRHSEVPAAGYTDQNIGVSNLFIEEYTDDLFTRYRGSFVSLLNPTSQTPPEPDAGTDQYVIAPSVTAASPPLSGSVPTPPGIDNYAVTLDWLEDSIRGENNELYTISDPDNVGVLTANGVVEINFLCQTQGEYFLGLTTTDPPAPICKPLVELGGTSCPAGAKGQLVVDPGGTGKILFECQPAASSFSCTVGSWIKGASCDITSGTCPSGGSSAQGTTACCEDPTSPGSECLGSPQRQYTCGATTGWNAGVNNSCTPNDSVCGLASGPATVGSSICCTNPPSRVCEGSAPNLLAISSTAPNGAWLGQVEITGGQPGETITLEVEIMQITEIAPGPATGFEVDFGAVAGTIDQAPPVTISGSVDLDGSGNATFNYTGTKGTLVNSAEVEVRMIARNGSAALPLSPANLTTIYFYTSPPALLTYTCVDPAWNPGLACAADDGAACSGGADLVSGSTLCCSANPTRTCSDAPSGPELSIVVTDRCYEASMSHGDIVITNGEPNEVLVLNVSINGKTGGTTVMGTGITVTPSPWKHPGVGTPSGSRPAVATVTLNSSGNLTSTMYTSPIIQTGVDQNAFGLVWGIQSRSSGLPHPAADTGGASWSFGAPFRDTCANPVGGGFCADTSWGVCSNVGEISCNGGCYPLTDCTPITGNPAVDTPSSHSETQTATSTANGCQNGATFQEEAEGINEPWKWTCNDGGSPHTCYGARKVKVDYANNPFEWDYSHIYTAALVDVYEATTVNPAKCTNAMKNKEYYKVTGSEWYVAKCNGSSWSRSRSCSSSDWCGDQTSLTDEITAEGSWLYYVP